MPTGKSKKEKKEKKIKVQKPPEEKPEEEQSRFDFGGLPARDLKKNLGCG